MAIVSLWWIAHEEPELRFQFFISPHAVVNFHSLHVRFLTDKHLLCSSDKKKKLICFIHRRCTEMPRISENQRNQAIGMLQAGAMVNDVAQHFGCSRQTIHNLNTRFVITSSVRDRPHPGQRRVTSQQDDRYITLTHLRNRVLPATATARQLGVKAQQSETVLGKTTFLFELVDRTLVRFSLPATGPLGCYELNTSPALDPSSVA